jgi:hypothetical protein
LKLIDKRLAGMFGMFVRLCKSYIIEDNLAKNELNKIEYVCKILVQFAAVPPSEYVPATQLVHILVELSKE